MDPSQGSRRSAQNTHRRSRPLQERLPKDLYPFVRGRPVLPAVARTPSIKIWKELRKGMRAEGLSLEELEGLEYHRVREILAHAYKRVPFYRQSFERTGLRPEDVRKEADLLAIPPTTKEEITANFPDEITAQGMDRSRWPPRGRHARS